MYGIHSGKVLELHLPDPFKEVIPGVQWGFFDEFFTPAYWAAQAWLDSESQRYSVYSLGETLEEEVAACLLGGFGIQAEIALAAFEIIRDKGLLSASNPTEDVFMKALREPLNIGGSTVHYRFPRRRAYYLSKALEILARERPPEEDDREFRNWLMTNLPGVGPKTASWITRNWLASDQVAIIDIHIQRAGMLIGFFDKSDSPIKSYFHMEAKFLDFARELGVRPSILDTLIWQQMREIGLALTK
jgi:thermostable 8-oxoguanine DNA glycosylase